MAKTGKQRTDVYEQVTNQIIDCIEAGADNWQMPWHKSGAGLNRPTNIDTNNDYRGINVISLWASAHMREFSTGTWGTYRQWQNKDCQVRKGEKSSIVIFYKEFKVEDADTNSGETTLETRRVARASYVFNADQVDGYEAPELPEQTDPVVTLQATERFISGTGAEIRHGGQSAFYQPGGDFIQIPDEARFQGTETSTATQSYYGTLLHELTHWTGVKPRCDRQFGKRFGDDAYAMEELVAELGAAFLCADLGITLEPRADHAAYLDHWLKVMKADKKAIFTAASQAAKASDFLTGLQSRIQEAA